MEPATLTALTASFDEASLTTLVLTVGASVISVALVIKGFAIVKRFVRGA